MTKVLGDESDVHVTVRSMPECGSGTACVCIYGCDGVHCYHRASEFKGHARRGYAKPTCTCSGVWIASSTVVVMERFPFSSARKHNGN